MGKKIKLCKMVKKDALEEELKTYLKLVIDGQYICLKCGRVANDENVLCKGKKMAKL